MVKRNIDGTCPEGSFLNEKTGRCKKIRILKTTLDLSSESEKSHIKTSSPIKRKGFFDFFKFLGKGKELSKEPVQHEIIKAYTEHVSKRKGLEAAEIIYRDGVKLIGQGTYGCVTNPPIPATDCGTGKDEDYDFTGLVSKVLNKKEAETEIVEGIKLSAIDVLISGERGTLSARYKYGVYALFKCKFPIQDKELVKAFNKAVGGPCQAGSAQLLGAIVYMQKASGDLIHGFKKHTNMKIWLRPLKNALEGLYNMHKHGKYHFDIKPANLLYFEEGKSITVKLNDFGLVETFGDPNFDRAPCLNDPWYYYPYVGPMLFSIFTEPTNAQRLHDDMIKIIDFSISIGKLKGDKEGIKNFIRDINEDFQVCRYNIDKSCKTKEEKIRGLAERIDLYSFKNILDIFVASGVPKALETFCKNIDFMKYSSEEAVVEYEKVLTEIGL